jgi:signal transduction histidine kinase
VRRRLVLTYLTMLAVVLIVLEIPLAISYAQRQRQQLYLDRLGDTAHFAALANPVLETKQGRDALLAELTRYDQVYGVAVAIVDNTGIQISSRPANTLSSDTLGVRLETTTGASRAEATSIPWPWDDQPMVVTQQIGYDGQPLGAAVTISSTEQLNSAVMNRWLLLGFGGLLALLFSPLAALPLGRWILRPVRDLDALVHEVADGKLDAQIQVASGGPVELQRLAHSFQAMIDTVRTSLEQQKAFVADASHQLRNPLTALRLRVENLEPLLSPEGRDELALAVEEADRLSYILDNLLQLARAEQSEQAIDTVDVGRIVDSRVEAWRAATESKNIILQRSGTEHVKAQALPGALDRALDALLDNALKFAPEGSSIDVCVVTYASQVDVHVVDEGPGLTTMERERATQRFWRDKHQQNKEGSGLGLTIAEALIAASGGKLDLLENEPTGLDVRIRLTSDAELARRSVRRPALNQAPS